MHNILLEIIDKKKEDVEKQKQQISLLSLRAASDVTKQYHEDQYRLLKTRLLHQLRLVRNDVALIAEVKLASPSTGTLGSKEEILNRVIQYEKAGANAISFITEKRFFNGDISYIQQIKKKVNLPVLQKDFVIDKYQIYEARNAGSDALLLIARFVDTETLQQFVLLCQGLHIEPVVEINNDEDLEKAMKTQTRIIAVNARNLEDFAIDIDAACTLLGKIPDTFIKLGFSGITSRVEVEKYRNAGAKGMLVGTELMKAKNIKNFINELVFDVKE